MGEIDLKTAYKLRFIPMIIFALSAIFNWLKLSAAFMPYQDPTAQMLQEQIHQ